MVKAKSSSKKKIGSKKSSVPVSKKSTKKVADDLKSVRLHHRVKRNLSSVKKRHIRTSIAIVGVIFLTVVTMMIVYRGHNFPINWFSIIVVSTILALILGAIEYLYIVRVKGY